MVKSLAKSALSSGKILMKIRLSILSQGFECKISWANWQVWHLSVRFNWESHETDISKGLNGLEEKYKVKLDYHLYIQVGYFVPWYHGHIHPCTKVYTALGTYSRTPASYSPPSHQHPSIPIKPKIPYTSFSISIPNHPVHIENKFKDLR